MPQQATISDSRVDMTELVMPQEINPLGSVFGGWVMALIDKAAAMAATRHCRGPVVTASVDNIDFLAPMSLGNIVRVSATLTCIFKSSMEVAVVVTSEDPRTRTRVKTCSAFLTMVCVDEKGRPRPAPPLTLTTDEERRLAREAEARRQQRLAHRSG